MIIVIALASHLIWNDNDARKLQSHRHPQYSTERTHTHSCGIVELDIECKCSIYSTNTLALNAHTWSRSKWFFNAFIRLQTALNIYQANESYRDISDNVYCDYYKGISKIASNPNKRRLYTKSDLKLLTRFHTTALETAHREMSKYTNLFVYISQSWQRNPEHTIIV